MSKRNKAEKNNEELHEEKTADDLTDNAQHANDCETCADKESAEDKLRAELAAEHEKYMRLAAEYDNYRKRSKKERDAMYQDVKAETITKLLPVYDNLERALAQKCEDEAFYKGVEMTMTQLVDILSKLGVSMIPALNETFDPEIHNAVMHIEDEDLGQGLIVEEFEKGFKLGEKVIRYSAVKVAN